MLKKIKKPANNHYQAIIFDMYNTLIYQTGGYQTTTNYIAGLFDFPTHAYKEARLSTYQKALIGEYQNAIQRAHATLQNIIPDPSMKLLEDVVNAEISHRKHLLSTFPDVLPIIKLLKLKGFKLGLLSNTTPEWEAVFKSTIESKYFDALIYSYRVKLIKPNPKIFKIAVDQLKVNVNQSIYVGDGEDNEFLGAKTAGLTTVAIIRNNNFEQINLQKSYVDHTIDTLEKLSDILFY